MNLNNLPTIKIFFNMKLGTIYIAGKISGLDPKDVQIKFDEAAKKFEQIGFDVIIPVQIVHQYADGFNTDWDTAMELCMEKLTEATHIYMLQDWQDSNGAIIEHEKAKELNLSIIYQKNTSPTKLNYGCIFLLFACFLFWATILFFILKLI